MHDNLQSLSQALLVFPPAALHSASRPGHCVRFHSCNWGTVFLKYSISSLENISVSWMLYCTGKSYTQLQKISTRMPKRSCKLYREPLACISNLGTLPQPDDWSTRLSLFPDRCICQSLITGVARTGCAQTFIVGFHRGSTKQHVDFNHPKFVPVDVENPNLRLFVRQKMDGVHDHFI